MILENETKNKKTIKLRKLAVQDLNTTFSRHLGGRIYRHYMVPVSSSIIGLDPTEEVCKFIELEEGEGTQVVIVSEADRVLNRAQVSSNIIDAMGILSLFPELQKMFAGKGYPHTLYQRPWKYTWKEKILRFIQDVGNDLIFRANLLIAKWQTRNMTPEQIMNSMGDIHQGFFFDRLKFAQERINQMEKYHMIAISFEEGEELAAQEAFINDLKVLQEKNLVLAYLAKPQLMKLVDEVGTGKNYYTLFCMVFVDTPKIEKELGQTNFSNNTLILNKIGCKLESGEILTNWLGNRSPARKYHVEEVRIGVKQYDELKNSMVESYSAQQEHLQSKAQEFVKKKASFWNDYTHSEPNPSGS